jgi:hypothetical protein
MASDGGNGGRWSDDLPCDLLGAIYRRCCPPYDRARFTAVCTSWRDAALSQPKVPAMPLLYPSTGNGLLDQKARAYSPEDGGLLRARLPWFPHGMRVVGSYEGGWVALAADCRIEIMNLFTSAWVPGKGQICPVSRKSFIEKVVFSEIPTSKDCILVSMIGSSTIALCRLGWPSGGGGGWTTQRCGRGMKLLDIAFCNGELYGLSCSHLLYKLIIGLNKDNAAVVISFVELTILMPKVIFYPRYILELGGKLAIAAKVKAVSRREARIFKVFELASSDTTQSCKYTWVEVTSLGDHALFLGTGCCKAVHVSTEGMHGKVKRNCIYYSEQDCSSLYEDSECLARLDLGSCTAFYYESQGVDHLVGIISRGYHYNERGDYSRNSCSWILPPYF